MGYRFAHFIGLAKGSPKESASSSSAGETDGASNKKRRLAGNGAEVAPQLEEMEVFMKHADLTFSFPIPVGEHPAPGSGAASGINAAAGPAPTHRVVFVLSRARLDNVSE